MYIERKGQRTYVYFKTVVVLYTQRWHKNGVNGHRGWLVTFDDKMPSRMHLWINRICKYYVADAAATNTSWKVVYYQKVRKGKE